MKTKPDACFHRHDILEVTDEFTSIFIFHRAKQEPGKLIPELASYLLTIEPGAFTTQQSVSYLKPQGNVFIFLLAGVINREMDLLC